MKRTVAVLGVLIGLAAIAGAQSPQTTPSQQPSQPQSSSTTQVATAKQPGATQSQQVLYGSQLMTPAERAEYRSKMRSLKTQEERDAFRAEHHKMMQARAKERGVTLPDMPPGRGMGKGSGAGKGMGGGMGGGQAKQDPPKSN